MANVSFDSQILFVPHMMADPKPMSQSLTNGLSGRFPIVISSDEESDYEDLGYLSGTSDTPVLSLDEVFPQPAEHGDAQSGGVASIEGRNAASSAGGDCGAVGPSVKRASESRNTIALGQEPQALGIKRSPAQYPHPTRPVPLSVPPGLLQPDQDAASLAINHTGTGTTNETSISEEAAYDEAADGLCRTLWTKDDTRYPRSSARQFDPYSPLFEGDTSRQSTPHRNSTDEGQNESEGAGSGDANDKEGDTWPRQRCETPPTDNSLDTAPNYDNDVEELLSQQQKTGGPARSTPALSPRSFAPGTLREEDQPVAAGSASCEVRQASDLEDATYGNTTHEMPRASLPRGQPPRASNLRRRSGPQPRDSKHRDSTSRHDSATESNSHDSVEPPRTKPKSGQMRASNLRRRCRPRSTFNADTDDEAEAEPAQRAGCQDMPRHPSRRRYDRAKAAEDEDMYCPEGSDREQDEDDDDDLRPPPRKRHKVGPTSRTTLRKTATGRQVRPNGAVSRPRQVQTSAPGQRSSGGLGMPHQPSSRRCGGEERTVQAPVAEFQEWPLQDAILKRVIENGLVTFQIQFTWNPCANHRREESGSEGQQYEPLLKRRAHRANKMPPPKQTEDLRAEVDEEWEVQGILASRTYYRKLQYQVRWIGCDDDQKWYNAAGFKGSPHLLGQYHADHPEMPGPPVRLKQWLRAYEDGVEAPDHPDDNKPAKAASTEST